MYYQEVKLHIGYGNCWQSMKFPAAVMVIGVISNKKGHDPPHFFKRGLLPNSGSYIDVMRDVIKPSMDQVAGGHQNIFQQDGAPANNAKLTQTWFSGNLPHLLGKGAVAPKQP